MLQTVKHNIELASKCMIVFTVQLKKLFHTRMKLKTFKLTGLVSHQKHFAAYRPSNFRELADAAREEERMLKYGVIMPRFNPSNDIDY